MALRLPVDARSQPSTFSLPSGRRNRHSLFKSRETSLSCILQSAVCRCKLQAWGNGSAVGLTALHRRLLLYLSSPVACHSRSGVLYDILRRIRHCCYIAYRTRVDCTKPKIRQLHNLPILLLYAVQHSILIFASCVIHRPRVSCVPHWLTKGIF